MKKTENYNLNKPELHDYYSVDVQNDNMDIIDEELKKQAEHTEDEENPHKVTAEQVGLGNVNNTSDEDKPVSKATQEALNTKASVSDLTAHTGDTSNPHNVTKAQVGLGNVENKSSATIRGELTKSNVTNALGYTPINSSTKGSANGLAELDENGKVLASQLPSYVDDTVEGYLYNSKFYKESAHTTVITGESSKIYVDLSTNKIYRWSGSAFVVISDTLALGETSSTAYRGDRGKIAYDHSQSTHAPSDAQKNQNAFSYVKVGDTTVSADTTTDTLTLVAGENVTITPDATNDKITIKSTNTTYSNMTGATSSASGKAGLVPAPASGKQTSFLRGDGTWVVPTNTTYSNFVKSGSGAKAGLVPAPSTTAGTTKYLREDGTWVAPPNTTYSNFVKSGSSAKAGLVPAPSTTAGTTKYLREDGTWTVPPKVSVANNLTTTSTGMALDATQGKALNDKINSLFIDEIVTIQINANTNIAYLPARSDYNLAAIYLVSNGGDYIAGVNRRDDSEQFTVFYSKTVTSTANISVAVLWVKDFS